MHVFLRDTKVLPTETVSSPPLQNSHVYIYLPKFKVFYNSNKIKEDCHIHLGLLQSKNHRAFWAIIQLTIRIHSDEETGKLSANHHP